jgi:Fructose-2,6-bisphosphatase
MKKLKLYCIRHGETYGNSLKRYIGVTEEVVTAEGFLTLDKIHYEQVEHVFTSPLRRCIQSSEYIYRNIPKTVIADLRETDFGEFENKNYQELKDNIKYQEWIDTQGKYGFPNGETPTDVKKRCEIAIDSIIKICQQNAYQKVAIVTHGGTIMSIMEAFVSPHKAFYEWSVQNGEGYVVEVEEWQNNNKKLKVINKLQN